MCGTLKYERIPNKIGNLVSCSRNQVVTATTRDGKAVIARWLGFIQEESGKPKLPHQIVKINASEYTERGVVFPIEEDHGIKAYLIEHSRLPGGKGIFIITREANDWEYTLCKHDRQPRLVVR